MNLTCMKLNGSYYYKYIVLNFNLESLYGLVYMGISIKLLEAAKYSLGSRIWCLLVF